ncbi:MAG: M50 family metallopeptidase [Bacteroidia bacterium]|nr:M50 family metallopeptidase [Bacteroidia bacterium]
MDDTTLQKTPKFNKDYVFLGLILSGIITLVLGQFQLGRIALYPFTILGTWFHEMGHGLTAWILQGNFEYLEIFSTGSGLAHISYGKLILDHDLGQALISAGGLLGPPLVGAIFILLGARTSTSRITLFVFSALMIISSLVWVRTTIGLVVILGLALVAILIALKASRSVQQFAIQFVGVQAAVTTYRQVWYLFQGEAIINGKVYLSDTGQIASSIGLTYWIWGTIIATLSAILLLGSLWLVFRNRRG